MGDVNEGIKCSCESWGSPAAPACCRPLLGLPTPLPCAAAELCGPWPAAPGQATAVPAWVGGHASPAHPPCTPPGSPPGTERLRGGFGCWQPRQRPENRCSLRDGAVAMPSPLPASSSRCWGASTWNLTKSKWRKKNQQTKMMFLNSSLAADPKQLFFCPEFFGGGTQNPAALQGGCAEVSAPGAGQPPARGTFSPGKESRRRPGPSRHSRTRPAPVQYLAPNLVFSFLPAARQPELGTSPLPASDQDPHLPSSPPALSFIF